MPFINVQVYFPLQRSLLNHINCISLVFSPMYRPDKKPV